MTVPFWKKHLPDLRHDSEFWRRAARFGAVHGPETFVRLSPPLVGLACALALPQARRHVRGMLELAGQRPSSRQMAMVFSRYAMSLSEALAMGSGRNDRMNARIVGDSSFQRARAAGRGVIVATAHTSGWYAAGPVLGSVYADEVLLVMQRERDASAERIQHEGRERMGLKVAHVGDDPLAAVPLLGHLRKGGIVALQIDRVVGKMRGVTTKLFDSDFSMPEGAFKLAAISGAPIVLVLGKRQGFLQYEVRVNEAVSLPARPTDTQIGEAAALLARALENFIREDPTHWYHFAGGQGA